MWPSSIHSHFWHRGFRTFSEPADRPPDQPATASSSVLLGAWQRLRSRRTSRWPMRCARRSCRARSPLSGPGCRAEREARRRRRRLTDHHDGDVRAPARRGLPGQPARLRHRHHVAQRTGCSGAVRRVAGRRAGRRRLLDGRPVGTLDPARLPPPRQPSTRLPRHLTGHRGTRPLGPAGPARGDRRLVRPPRHPHDHARPDPGDHRRTAGDPPAGARSRRAGRPGRRRAPDLPARDSTRRWSAAAGARPVPVPSAVSEGSTSTCSSRPSARSHHGSST